MIPTYNGQRHLGRVLSALAGQTLAAERFEVLVVDNNSTVDVLAGPGTPEALNALSARGISFRCVREPRQGLSLARAAGAAASRGAMLNFLDDDNVPAAGYLAAGLDALEDNSVGMLVSRVFPEYEVEPSAAVRRRQHLFAVNFPLGEAAIRWPAAVRVCPTLGAGMWIRKTVYDSIQAAIGGGGMPDRVGDVLTSGGDIELGIAAGKLGFDRLYVPELEIGHIIPSARVRPRYVRRLITGIVRSTDTLDALYGGRTRCLAVRSGRLATVAGAGWIIALLRGDTRREYLFMLTSAWASFRGPFSRMTPLGP